MSSTLTQDDTFYVWPKIEGKTINHQWGEIRKDTAMLKALARNSWQDREDGVDALNALTALTGFNHGELDFNNRYRVIFRKSDKALVAQKNDGTEETPDWVDAWSVRWSDGQFTVNSIYTQGYYGILPTDQVEMVGEAGFGANTEHEDVKRLFFNSEHGFYVTNIKSGANAGGTVVNQSFHFGRARTYANTGVEWEVEHNFSTTPVMVQVTDNSGRVVIPDTIDVSDPNKAYFYFNESFSGYAMISSGGVGGEKALHVETLNFDLPTGEDQMVYLDTNAMYAYDVDKVSIKCESGSATADFYILGEGEQGWGVPIPGMTGIAVSTAKNTPEATSPRSVAIGDELRMTVLDSNNAVHLRGTVKIRRT